MASISPVRKKFKHFILALKSPTYRDFMIKKLLKSKISKSHTWAPLSIVQMAQYAFEYLIFNKEQISNKDVFVPSVYKFHQFHQPKGKFALFIINVK